MYIDVVNSQKICGLQSIISLKPTHPSMTTVQNSTHQSKDVGGLSIIQPSSLPYPLNSGEQTILRQIRDVISYSPCTEHELQFAPQWSN